MSEYERSLRVRRITTLMSACRLIPNREDILALWDANCYDQMTDEELYSLQTFMESAYRAKTTPATGEIRKLRSQVLAHLSKMGLYASPEDWTKINRFLLKKRICGRLLYMLDAEELRTLVRKLRAIGDKKPSKSLRTPVQVTPILIFPGDGPGVVN